MQNPNKNLIAPAPAVAPINVNPNEIGDLNKTLLSYYSSHTEKQDKIIRDLKQENVLLSKGIEPAFKSLKEFWITHGQDNNGNHSSIKDFLMSIHNMVFHYMPLDFMDTERQTSLWKLSKIAEILNDIPAKQNSNNA
jgi:hypothetical protein